MPTTTPATTQLARRLFSADVAVAEVDPRDVLPEAVLWESERPAVARAIESRQQQYAAGRHCAREAMRDLGVPSGPVVNDEERAPTFPEGLVGTITHTKWWGAAALAHSATHRALGVDVEPDTPLKTPLFRSVLTAEELSLVAAWPEPERGLLGKLIFSAKECAYKCQFTVSRTFYGFHGMRVSFELTPGALPSEGAFCAHFLRDAGPFTVGDALHGRFARAGGYVMTGMELRHER